MILPHNHFRRVELAAINLVLSFKEIDGSYFGKPSRRFLNCKDIFVSTYGEE